ncbi:hypothetical protein HD806DRAFT_516387 [Xylariaceae sp. AK1471]|nr:hypothetical protein HD806DRAFT_516387 [Xylariaceae sp. AK1471]
MLHGGVDTIGGGRRGGKYKPRKSSGIEQFTTIQSAVDSQEHIVKEVPLQSLKVSAEPNVRSCTPNVVYISTEVDVVHEDVGGQSGDEMKQRIHENW